MVLQGNLQSPLLNQVLQCTGFLVGHHIQCNIVDQYYKTVQINPDIILAWFHNKHSCLLRILDYCEAACIGPNSMYLFIKNKKDSFLLCNDFTHTMPIVMLVLIHNLENLQYFHLKNLKYQVYMLIFAVAINMIYTFQDAPVYPFITYQDIGTPIFFSVGIIVMFGIFLGMMKITTLRTKNLKKE